MKHYVWTNKYWCARAKEILLLKRNMKDMLLCTVPCRLSPYLSVLDFFLNLYFTKLILNLIFELDFLSIWNLIFAGYTGSKNQVWNRQKIKLKNLLREIQIWANQVQVDRGLNASIWDIGNVFYYFCNASLPNLPTDWVSFVVLFTKIALLLLDWRITFVLLHLYFLCSIGSYNNVFNTFDLCFHSSWPTVGLHSEPKLENWKMVFCYQNCSTDREKLLKFVAGGREFLTSLEQFIEAVKGQNNFW